MMFSLCSSSRRRPGPSVFALENGPRVIGHPWPAWGEYILCSVSKRLTGGHRVRDAGLGLFHLRQFHEVVALQVEQPLRIDGAAAFDVAAAQGVGDAGRDFHVERGSTVDAQWLLDL